MYNLRNQSIDFDFSPQYIVPEAHYGKLQRSILYPGDLLMNIVGPPLGKLAIIPECLPESNTNQAAVVIRPLLHKDIINKYLFYYLEEMTEIESIATKGSAGQVNISLTQSKMLRIPLPPLQEQGRIVQCIRQWTSFCERINSSAKELKQLIIDAKAKTLDQAIHGKLVPQDPSEESALSLLQRINPAFRPSHNLHYKGEIPSGWQECTLKDLFEITMGQSPEGFTINRKDGTEFHQGKICFSDKYLSSSGIYTTSPTKIAEAGDLLCCVRAPVGVFNVTQRRICIGRGLAALRAKTSEIDINYWFYILSGLTDYYNKKATGSTFKAISREVICNTPVLLPPLREQKRILERITTLLSAINTIAYSINELE